MLRSCVVLVLIALAVTSCASGASGKVEIVSISDTPSIADLHVEKYPDCDSNEFAVKGRLADGAPVPLLFLQGPGLSNELTSTTVTSDGMFTASATAASGIESVFALTSGNADVLATLEVHGLIDDDCSPFGF